MAGSPVWIGVDAGTSAAKVAAFDAHGVLVGGASRPLGLRHPQPSWTEQDQYQVVTAVEDALAEVAAGVAGRPVRLVALTGQGDGCWLTDRRGAPLRPAISWMDGRAADVVGRWSQGGVTAKVFVENGTALFPGASGAILAWLDRNDPAVLDRAHTAGHVTDVLLQRLTGLRATDSTNSSTPFGSATAQGAYSDRALALTGLTHRAELLAPVARPLPWAPLGPTRAELPVGLPVVGAPYDIPACGIGAGVREVGDGLLILGTTLACAVLRDRLDTSGPPVGLTLAMPDGRWLRLLAAMAGTAGLDWAVSVLGLSIDRLDDVLADSPPGAHGVEVLPYLAPSGERAPFLDPAARAQFGGLSITTTRSDLIRGLCEGLAYSARNCFEQAGPTGPVYVCGGGSRSGNWLQILASALNRPVKPATSGHVGARGAVLAAARALDTDLDPDSWLDQAEPILPIPADVELYEHGYRRFLAQLDAARALWAR